MDDFLLVAGGIVVGHGHDMVGTEHLDVLVTKGVECLGTGYLMGIKAVNIQLGGTVLHVLYDVGIPNLVK